MRAHHRRVRRGQLGARRVERHARREAAEEIRHPVGAVGNHRRAEVMRAGHDVRDEFGLGRIRHRGLEHAHHRRSARTEPDGLADHAGIAVQRGGPEPVGEHRSARRFRTIVLRVEQAAEHRAKPHHVEIRAADHTSPYDARLAAETDHRELDRGEVAECADAGDARLDVVDFRH